MKGLIKLIIFVMIFVVLTSNAYAIGVSPATAKIGFEPNLRKTVDFRVVNNEDKEMKAVIFVQGELNNSIDLKENLVTVPAGSSKTINYDVTLPSSFKKPGKHGANIVVMEVLTTSKGETKVGAAAAVVHQLTVDVPYPGKYAEPIIHVKEANAGEPVKFFIEVRNLGTDDIQKAKATIDILGPTNQRLATLETDDKSINSKQVAELKATWDSTGFGAGLYHAVVVLDYDGYKARVEDNFGLGSMFVDIEHVFVNDFKLGDVAKFNVDLINMWNQPLDNVYTEIFVRDVNQNEIGNFKSANVRIESLERKTVTSYWDTQGVETGNYNAEIYAHYAGKSTKKNMTLVITFDQLKASLLGGTASAIAKTGGEKTNLSSLIAILIVVLVVANVGWFVYLSKKRKN